MVACGIGRSSSASGLADDMRGRVELVEGVRWRLLEVDCWGLDEYARMLCKS